MIEKRPDRTLGSIHDEFWAACEREELHLQRCGDCGHVPWPPVQTCEQCGGGDLTWKRASGRGTVLSWCAFVQDYYKGLFPLPHDCILVALEEGPLFVSNPKGFAFDAITPDMPVKLAFVDCEDSAGTFKLPVFEKA
jgi:uncharacterized OB-fold protein